MGQLLSKPGLLSNQGACIHVFVFFEAAQESAVHRDESDRLEMQLGDMQPVSGMLYSPQTIREGRGQESFAAAGSLGGRGPYSCREVGTLLVRKGDNYERTVLLQALCNRRSLHLGDTIHHEHNTLLARWNHLLYGS
jgi:hypothetical protein